MSEVVLNTYRGYVLRRNPNAPESPDIAVVYVRAPKYGEAWKIGRAAASHSETMPDGVGVTGTPTFYSDAECSKVARFDKSAAFVAADDMKPRNAKLDKDSLKETLANDDLSPEEKLAAMAASLGVTLPVATGGGKGAKAGANA